MSDKKSLVQRGDMTSGNPVALILRFALPLFIGNLFQQIYTIADTMIAGYHLGDGAIAAIGATSSLYALLIDFAAGLNSGYGIVVSRMFGAKDQNRLKKTIATVFLLNIAVTVLLTLLSVTMLRPLMHLLSVPESIFEAAHAYIFVILAGMIATISYNMFAGILRAVGNSKMPLVFLIISCVINLSMDLLFIAVLHWGVRGAAAATVFAEACSAILAGGYLLRNYQEILPQRAHFVLEKELLRDVASSGFAMAVMLCVVDLGSVFYQRAINQLGEILITAHTAARRIIGIFMMPLGSIATAYSTFVSQNWGAGKKARVRQSLKQALAMEVGWGVFSAMLVWLLGTWMIRLLTGSSNPQVIDNAVLSIRIHFVCYPALGILLALRTMLQAMGKKVVPVISSGFELGVKLLAAAWMIPLFGYIAVCLTEPVIWTICAVFLIIVFLITKPLHFEREVPGKEA